MGHRSFHIDPCILDGKRSKQCSGKRGCIFYHSSLSKWVVWTESIQSYGAICDRRCRESICNQSPWIPSVISTLRSLGNQGRLGRLASSLWRSHWLLFHLPNPFSTIQLRIKLINVFIGMIKWIRYNVRLLLWFVPLCSIVWLCLSRIVLWIFNASITIWLRARLRMGECGSFWCDERMLSKHTIGVSMALQLQRYILQLLNKAGFPLWGSSRRCSGDHHATSNLFLITGIRVGVFARSVGAPRTLTVFVITLVLGIRGRAVFFGSAAYTGNNSRCWLLSASEQFWSPLKQIMLPRDASVIRA